MNSTCGHPRDATDAQVAIILDSWRYRRTIEDWARICGVSKTTIVNVLKTYSTVDEWIAAKMRRAGRGRKPSLSVLQIQMLLDWNRTRRTRAQLAKELELTEGVVADVIRRRGQYKRCSPERHEAISAARRRKLAHVNGLDWPTVEHGARNALSRMRPEGAPRNGYGH